MILKKLITIIIGLIIAFGLCELILRIYNPFQSRVRGNEIILKSNYKRKVSIDPPIPGLDTKVFYSTNSLGFRGPEPPKDWVSHKTILTVGGSTTECSLLSDDSTWSAKLFKKLKSRNANVWLNNAGLDGCSTYGHEILMRDYIVKLKPNYVIFLIGINDLVKSSFDNEDGFLINRKESFWRTILKKSELITTISNLLEAIKSQKANVAHGNSPDDYLNNDLNLGDSIFKQNTENKLKKMIPEYIARVERLAKTCHTNQIVPIFITQPKYDARESYSWQVMNQYNQALISYCNSEGLQYIDLGNTLPKSKSYYYDQIHYTNAGAEKIADLLFPDINTLLNKNN